MDRPALDWALSDSFYWLWSGFFSLVVILGLLGALYQEDWTITEPDIVVTKSVGPWRRTRRVPRARSLGIRVEIITGGDDGPIFPYRLRFLDAERKDPGSRIELQLIPELAGVGAGRYVPEADAIHPAGALAPRRFRDSASRSRR